MDERSCPRAACQLSVKGRCLDNHQEYHGVTRDAGMGGAFLLDVPPWCSGSRILLSFPRSEISSRDTDAADIDVNGAIVRTTTSGAAVKFDQLPGTESQRLYDFLWPTWDRENLLEGLMLMSRLVQPENLTGWLQLTSALAMHRK